MSDQQMQSNRPEQVLGARLRDRFAFLLATETQEAACLIMADELRCYYQVLEDTNIRNEHQAAVLKAATHQVQLVYIAIA